MTQVFIKLIPQCGQGHGRSLGTKLPGISEIEFAGPALINDPIPLDRSTSKEKSKIVSSFYATQQGPIVDRRSQPGSMILILTALQANTFTAILTPGPVTSQAMINRKLITTGVTALIVKNLVANGIIDKQSAVAQTNCIVKTEIIVGR